MVPQPRITSREADRQTSIQHPKHEILSSDEATQLNLAEGLIARHLSAFFEVGAALLEIKQRRLYRAAFSTFEEYCRTRWQLNRSHAYRLVEAAEIKTHLSPIGDIPPPENECQVRPLSGLTASAAKKAWKTAVERAGNKPPTGELVRKVVAEIGKKPAQKRGATQQESWQRHVEPLLQEALKELKRGGRDQVEHLLNKAILQFQIGKSHEYD